MADSLNRLSYGYRYVNLDSCRLYAGKALVAALGNSTSIAQAYNNLAFHYFMKMDFEKSRSYYQKVYEVCRNELELLVADVGMMKICQRTSENKKFYDFRNSALQRMKRIDEDVSALDKNEKLRLVFARSEFHIVSSIYFFYLQQLPQSLEEINKLYQMPELSLDTAQYLYYLYMKGSGSLCEGIDAEDVTIKEFDYLTRCLGEGYSYIYFEANCLQALAEMLNDAQRAEVLKRRRGPVMKMLNAENLPDSLLPSYFAGKALEKFRQYGDIYQIAGAYRTLGSCLIGRGRYAEAVDSLQKALDYVTYHHNHYYSCADSIHKLSVYSTDSVPTELLWMRDDKVQTVPEWIARIREQLSIAYAGLGLKVKSDYNRNIYLDILDVTRQDKELESRYEWLEQESSWLNGWLFVVMIVLLLMSALFILLNRRWKRNNAQQVEKLNDALELCRKLLALPLSEEPEEEAVTLVVGVIREDFRKLFGCEVDIKTDNGAILLEPIGTLGKDERALLEVVRPYVEHAVWSVHRFAVLDDEYRQLETERYIYEQHIAENKRQNVVKKACVSIVTGIVPYIDRIINEVRKLSDPVYSDNEDIKRERYRYIDELATRINEHNEILASWIKMKQGTLSLNIEIFELEELFGLLLKGRRTFENKNQTLDVKSTKAVVKADKALTLFMINTLMENARKYTPEGGYIEVFAEETADFVEISVKDNGRGLSVEDVERIMNEKVYDSAQIGMEGTEADTELKKNKGSGFGLMNCKGIIEKYRKTNQIFKVCVFAVDSIRGKGSRFYFRLPLGMQKTMSILFCIMASWVTISCSQTIHKSEKETQEKISYYDKMLDRASAFADSVYFSNLYRRYETALIYADSAVHYLNLHYLARNQNGSSLMKLDGQGDVAEIIWWNDGFETDYHIVLDVRNEAAVAALALKQWKVYQYNNSAYTLLYKLLSRDTSLERYCVEMERSSANTTVSIILCVMLLILFWVGYYLLFFRHRMLYRFNLEQVLEINKVLLRSSVRYAGNDSDWKDMWQKLLHDAFECMSDLLPLCSWGVAVSREEVGRSEPVFYPNVPAYGGMPSWIDECFISRTRIYSDDGCLGFFPLLADWDGSEQCAGVLIVQTERKQFPAEGLLLELIARYVGILLVNNTIRVKQTYRDLELLSDDKARARHEENILHVQNLVLDNCLSAIKHETLYYPNRIKQIADRLFAGLSHEKEEEQTRTMTEVVEYYKGVFSLLASCAVRQLEEVTFRRQTVVATDILSAAMKCVKRLKRKTGLEITLHTEAEDVCIKGDRVLLFFLVENLLGEAFGVKVDGDLYLNIVSEGDFVKCSFSDTRRTLTQEILNSLFYPGDRMINTSSGQLVGTEYLICKQIIREHDEYMGKRGCRINAEVDPSGGFTVWFTVPRAEINKIKDEKHG